MNIKIELHLESSFSKSLAFASTFVDEHSLEIDLDHIAAKAAYRRIKEIKRETGYRELSIDKIIYNGQHDITDKVKKLFEAPIDQIIEWELQGYI